jgi:hypothetical protein
MTPADKPRSSSLTPVLVGGSLAIILFDTLGALASRTLAFSYYSLAPASYLIYAGAGFFGARRAGWAGACFAGAITGVAESTIGWGISWAIGPGRPPGGYTGFGPLLFTIILVTALAAVLGCVGGLVARLIRRVPDVAA